MHPHCVLYCISSNIFIFLNVLFLSCYTVQIFGVNARRCQLFSWASHPSLNKLSQYSFYFAVCKRGLIDVSKQCLLGCVMQLKKHSHEISSPLHCIINEQQNKSGRNCQFNIFPTHRWQCILFIYFMLYNYQGALLVVWLSSSIWM